MTYRTTAADLDELKRRVEALEQNRPRRTDHSNRWLTDARRHAIAWLIIILPLWAISISAGVAGYVVGPSMHANGTSVHSDWWSVVAFVGPIAMALTLSRVVVWGGLHK